MQEPFPSESKANHSSNTKLNYYSDNNQNKYKNNQQRQNRFDSNTNWGNKNNYNNNNSGNSYYPKTFQNIMTFLKEGKF